MQGIARTALIFLLCMFKNTHSPGEPFTGSALETNVSRCRAYLDNPISNVSVLCQMLYHLIAIANCAAHACRVFLSGFCFFYSTYRIGKLDQKSYVVV